MNDTTSTGPRRETRAARQEGGAEDWGSRSRKEWRPLVSREQPSGQVLPELGAQEWAGSHQVQTWRPGERRHDEDARRKRGRSPGCAVKGSAGKRGWEGGSAAPGAGCCTQWEPSWGGGFSWTGQYFPTTTLRERTRDQPRGHGRAEVGRCLRFLSPLLHPQAHASHGRLVCACTALMCTRLLRLTASSPSCLCLDLSPAQPRVILLRHHFCAAHTF